ncbi:globin domain-containing protein [Saccharothrix violaceirubra]|uniref:nitric oxide dioxygenase n=1 Tax=Saccharothrix violaceirubra TaxID=413306 RepID=A0A7W7T1B8_9PSEU|nr:globin domain-containing protein [Saccharothrix violaceirubra]MBB4964753.1 nitric oxide dioxygenase [Saccharothrix violaceirubra]
MLSESSAAIVRATLPVVRAHAEEITGEFYGSLFAAHPALLNLFNRGNQASRKQRAALASAVVAYAEHLVGEGVDYAPIEDRIVHKHVSLGIGAQLYPVVGRFLLAAVGKVLGDAVTAEVAAAWDEVYWLLACTLIAAEARRYAELGVGTDVWRSYRVVDRVEEAEDVTSFAFAPVDGGPLPDFAPGQYVSVLVDLPDGGTQPRQYTLSRGPGRDTLRITVRRVRAIDGAPDGVVSTLLHDDLAPGDVVRLGPPSGENTLRGTGPLVLISAGIGITPTAAIVDHLSRTDPDRPVVVAHVERKPDRHALRGEIEGSALTNLETLTWYGRESFDAAGIPFPDGASAYLCGPLEFMRDVRAALLSRGVDPAAIHYEVFGPGMLDSRVRA